MSDSLKYNLSGALTVALLVSIYAVENIYYKIFMVSALIIGLIILFIFAQRSIEITNSQKRVYWIIIIPIISLIAYLFVQIELLIDKSNI